jgi:hypothetical protein
MTYDERFALATHLYVRLRRHLNRVVDAVWMAQNEDYAQEILRLARVQGHPELVELADRYERLLTGAAPKVRAAPPPPMIVDDIERVVAKHYTGALR